MYNQTKLIILSFLYLMSSYCYSIEKSLTNNGDVVGKWLITVSLGMDVPAFETLRLRNILLPVFTGAKGGEYQHLLDISDKGVGAQVDSKSGFTNYFNDAVREIKKFKNNNPNAATMVVIAITGHGVSKNGEYYLKINDSFFGQFLGQDVITGKELARILKKLDVDETILIMQSCYSGEFTNNYSTYNLSSFLDMFKLFSKEEKNKISIITPASKFISSPVNTWENILESSFYNDDIDSNGDHVISYGEWKQFLILESLRNQDYVPESLYLLKNEMKSQLPDLGIDLHFVEENIDFDLPLFFSRDGIELYKRGALKIQETIPNNHPTFDDIIQKKEIIDTFLLDLYRQSPDCLLGLVDMPPEFLNMILSFTHQRAFENVFLKDLALSFDIAKKLMLNKQVDDFLIERYLRFLQEAISFWQGPNVGLTKETKDSIATLFEAAKERQASLLFVVNSLLVNYKIIDSIQSIISVTQEFLARNEYSKLIICFGLFANLSELIKTKEDRERVVSLLMSFDSYSVSQTLSSAYLSSVNAYIKEAPELVTKIFDIITRSADTRIRQLAIELLAMEDQEQVIPFLQNLLLTETDSEVKETIMVVLNSFIPSEIHQTLPEIAP